MLSQEPERFSLFVKIMMFGTSKVRLANGDLLVEFQCTSCQHIFGKFKGIPLRNGISTTVALKCDHCDFEKSATVEETHACELYGDDYSRLYEVMRISCVGVEPISIQPPMWVVEMASGDEITVESEVYEEFEGEPVGVSFNHHVFKRPKALDRSKKGK